MRLRMTFRKGAVKEPWESASADTSIEKLIVSFAFLSEAWGEGFV